MAQVRQALKILEQTIPAIGADSEEGKDLLNIVTKLAKLAPANQAASGVEGTALQDLQRRAQQQAPMLALQRQQPGAGAGAPPPPAQPGGPGG
jgi:hypothetical protein